MRHLMSKIHFAMFDNPVVDPPVVPPVVPPTPEVPKGYLSQDKVNELLAAEKRKNQTEMQKQVSALEELRQKAQLTDEERAGLNQQIDNLQGLYQTAEERAKMTIEKQKKETDDRIKALDADAKKWKNQYESTEINRAFASAAVKHKAVSADQISAMLREKTAMAEVLDDAGKGTGNFAPMVDFDHTDKDGKAVKLKVSVDEAVKLMREKDSFANLFVDDRSGGTGTRGSHKGSQGNPGGKRTLKDLATMPQAEYDKLRKENPNLFRGL